MRTGWRQVVTRGAAWADVTIVLGCSNIWLLGLSHGLLAALAYPLVLGENPVSRLF